MTLPLHIEVVADPQMLGPCGPEIESISWHAFKNGTDRTEHCTFTCQVSPPNKRNNAFWWEVYRPLSGSTRACGRAPDRGLARAFAILAAEAHWVIDYCHSGRLPPLGRVPTETATGDRS